MTKDEAVSLLRAENPTRAAGDLEMYAQLFVEYSEAAENIAKNGSIVAHPRTSAPIENPYYKIKLAAMRAMRSFERLRTSTLWGAHADVKD
jgi:phage terminase small subunit